MQSSASINLIKTKVNIFDEILKWALSVGRLLVILTELVAFTTFVYRFSLDRTLIDLNDKIKQQQAIVGSLADREKVYVDIHDRLSIVNSVSDKGNQSITILNDIIKLKPEQVNLNSITVTQSAIEIDSDVTSISALSDFITSLREYSKSSSVTIQRIDNKSATNAINVIIQVKLKGAPASEEGI
jgi:Tfp pilus assembly protein PilN